MTIKVLTIITVAGLWVGGLMLGAPIKELTGAFLVVGGCCLYAEVAVRMGW